MAQTDEVLIMGHRSAGRWQEVRALSARLAPSHPIYYWYLAEALHNVDDNVAAEQAIRTYLSAFSEASEGYALAGRIWLALGRHSDAVSAYERAVQLSDDRWAVLAGLLRARVYDRGINACRELLAECIDGMRSAVPDEHLNYHFAQVASVLKESGEWATLGAFCESALPRMPQSHFVHTFLAMSASMTGDRVLADKSIQRALKIAPREQWIIDSYVEQMRRHNRFADATSYLKAQFAIWPENRALFLMILKQARLGGGVGDWGEFVAQHQDMHGDDFEVAVNLARVWLRYGDAARALDWAQRTQALAGPNTYDQLQSAMLLADAGAFEAAQAAYDRVAVVYPDWSRELSARVWYHVAAEQLDQVIHCERLLLERSPDSLGDMYILYAALVMSKRDDEAAAVLRTFESKDVGYRTSYSAASLAAFYFYGGDVGALKNLAESLDARYEALRQLVLAAIAVLTDRAPHPAEVIRLGTVPDAECLQLTTIGLCAKRHGDHDVLERITRREALVDGMGVMCTFKCCLATAAMTKVDLRSDRRRMSI